MIVKSKYEYGDKSLPITVKHRGKQVFNENCMIFEPVNNINDDVVTRWERVCKERGYPYAVYLVKTRKNDNGKFKFSYKFTMVTSNDCIKELNNPPNSEGVLELEEN